MQISKLTLPGDFHTKKPCVITFERRFVWIGTCAGAFVGCGVGAELVGASTHPTVRRWCDGFMAGQGAAEESLPGQWISLAFQPNALKTLSGRSGRTTGVL
ncbi:hypothetical protein SV7mr_34430 [Stieleria bergensis]|uniref:Uncharacterized protein n=1 Tax=Stieleria bergensis TaxID=2528025 RepID=A0A517SXP5_9BACT|nr:hypothetical protein SV7mr_34430 [Planctomycetes bacterium SV_7m_r]